MASEPANGTPSDGTPGACQSYSETCLEEQRNGVDPIFEDVLEGIVEAFALFDRQERFVVANSAFKDLLPEMAEYLIPGIGMEALLRRAVMTGIFPDALGNEQPWLQACLKRLRLSAPIREQSLKDGRWLRASARRTRSGMLALVGTDITELKRRENALSESESRYRMLAEQSPQGVLVHRDFKPIYANARFSQLFGYSPDDLKTQSAIMNLFTSDPRERAGAFDFFESKDDARAELLSFSARKKDGAVVDVEGVSQEVNWSGIHATQVTLHDVTARAEAHAVKRTIIDVMTAVAEAPGFHAALKIAIKTVCRNLGWSYGSVWIPDEGNQRLTLRAAWHGGGPNLLAFEEFSRLGSLAPGEGLAGGAWQNGKPHRVSASGGAADWRVLLQSKAAEHGLLSGLSVPVMSEGAIVAVLTFWTDQINAGDDQTLPDMIIAAASELGRTFERKRAEQALADSEVRFRNLIEGSLQGVFILKPDWEPLFINEAGARIFGYDSPAELMTREKIWSTVATSDRDRVRETSNARMRGDDVPDAYEFQGLHKDGSPVWVLCLVRSVIWDGEPANQATLIDVTERRLAEQQGKELNAQIEVSRRMEALGTLAGGVAHDINNALVPIIGLSEVLLDDLQDDPVSKDCIETILNSAEHIRNLSEQILAFSRADGDNLLVADLGALVAGALELLRSTLPSSVQIEQRLPNEPLYVQGDPTKLVQVVMNLMTNAAYAVGSSPGRITVSLAVETAGAGSDKVPGVRVPQAILTITDSGCGIPEDVLERIFDPFFTTKPVGDGTGLGLSVVHGIVTARGGTIRAQNNAEGGARFDIRLPIKQDDHPTCGPGSIQ